MTIKVGQTVNKSDYLVDMGSSGWSTAKHVHVGRKKDGVWIDVHDLIIKKQQMATPTQKELFKKLQVEYPHIDTVYTAETIYIWWENVGTPMLVNTLRRLTDLGDSYAKKTLDSFETHNGKGKNTPLGWYITDKHYKNIWFKSFLPVATK